MGNTWCPEKCLLPIVVELARKSAKCSEKRRKQRYSGVKKFPPLDLLNQIKPLLTAQLPLTATTMHCKNQSKTELPKLEFLKVRVNTVDETRLM